MSEGVVLAWVSAVGSAGSLLGFAAYVWIMLLNRRDDAEVRREQQAQGVSAWLDEGSAYDRDADYVICVHNNGVAPIFHCEFEYSLPTESEQRRTDFLHVIPPRVTAVRSLPVDVREVDPDALYTQAAVPEVRFTDSHGWHWRRDEDGVLHRLDRRTPRFRPRVRSARRSGSAQQWQRHEGVGS